MKKKIVIIIMLVFGLSGCNSQEQAQTTSADNNLVQVDPIKRLMSAKDVNLNENYQFAVTDKIGDNENIDYYKLSKVLEIQTANDSDYVLYSSAEDTQDINNMKAQSFSGDLKIDISETTYFVLQAIDRPIEVTISTME